MTPLGSDGTTYNVAVSVPHDGTVIVALKPGAAHDPAGNLSSASTSTDNSVTYDATAPTVTIDRAAGQADSSNAAPINFAVLFSEPVTGFTAGHVTVSGTAGATAAVVTPVGSDGTAYNVAVTGMAQDGTVIINMAAGAAHDQAGNPSAAATIVDNTVTYDTTAPTVTIDQAAGQADPTNAVTINFAVVFSEAVTGFAASDVTVSGTAGATTAVVTPVGSDGTAYNVAVTGMAHDGTVLINVAAGAAHDPAGNLSAAPTILDNSVTYNITPPSVTINQAIGQADPTDAPRRSTSR